MMCSVDANPLPNITWSVNQNFTKVSGNRLDVCGLAVVEGWVNSGLGLDEEELTLVLECTASSNNNERLMARSITQNRRAFKDVCESTARALQGMSVKIGNLE